MIVDFPVSTTYKPDRRGSSLKLGLKCVPTEIELMEQQVVLKGVTEWIEVKNDKDCTCAFEASIPRINKKKNSLRFQ